MVLYAASPRGLGWNPRDKRSKRLWTVCGQIVRSVLSRPVRGALRPLRFARALDLRSARLPSELRSSAHVSRNARFSVFRGEKIITKRFD